MIANTRMAAFKHYTRALRQLPLCGLDAQKHLALQVVPVQQVSKADILLTEDILCSAIYLQEVQHIRQHRTIWQEHSAKDFASYESYKRAGILYVFPPFITARMGQKIGRRPQTQLCGDALIFLWFFAKVGEAVRLAPGVDASTKLLGLADGFTLAFQTSMPGAAVDWLIGLIGAAVVRLVVYVKGKNAKKYRKDVEYGSARWSA